MKKLFCVKWANKLTIGIFDRPSKAYECWRKWNDLLGECDTYTLIAMGHKVRVDADLTIDLDENKVRFG